MPSPEGLRMPETGDFGYKAKKPDKPHLHLVPYVVPNEGEEAGNSREKDSAPREKPQLRLIPNETPKPENVRLGLGKTEYVAHARLSLVPKPEKRPLRIVTSNTAKHEAKHAVLALVNGTGVKRATVIPGPGYYGLTEMDRGDPIAAVGPHADGMSGTSHDVNITRAMGHDEGSLASTARSMMRDNDEEIDGVAAHLDAKGTLSGGEIYSVMNEVRRKKFEPKLTEATLYIETYGQKREIDVKVTKDNVIKFPEKGDIFNANKQDALSAQEKSGNLGNAA